ncbi:hypothetical protein JK628_02910 [Shewanella sp. KX20019]|uniref:hypothetical protein n=1 Tax=Shewanella sp. KX20019 TaxID=2803864 RepID=UPI001927DB6D|nr:hypothetical protein [Shewanella sp. KX20019]QQX80840.1 hypothetical protein JK628_02910 [Shewanella sp. KX20019]
MRLKDKSVNPNGMRPELVFALMMADQVYSEYGVEMVVTSINDARHSKTSLHYSGQAADLRIFNLPDGKSHEVLSKIKGKLLNDAFDVVLESDHIHLEFQPKRQD